MTVAELIAALQKQPTDARVLVIYDGSAGTVVDHVWISRGGAVILAMGGDVVYRDRDRPETAPTAAIAPYWKAPTVPESEDDDRYFD